MKIWRVHIITKDLWTKRHGLTLEIDLRRYGYEVSVGFGQGVKFMRGLL